VRRRYRQTWTAHAHRGSTPVSDPPLTNAVNFVCVSQSTLRDVTTGRGVPLTTPSILIHFMGWGPRAAPSQSWPSYPVGPARCHARTPTFVVPAMVPTGMSCACCVHPSFASVSRPSMKIWLSGAPTWRKPWFVLAALSRRHGRGRRLAACRARWRHPRHGRRPRPWRSAGTGTPRCRTPGRLCMHAHHRQSNTRTNKFN